MISIRRSSRIVAALLVFLVLPFVADALTALSPQQRPQSSSSLFSVSSDDQQEQPWLDKGLLLSSFTDGLECNVIAQDWLCDALVENLWKEEQQALEASLSTSNEFSPCNGPDIAMWERLENIDDKMKELYSNKSDEDDATAISTTCSWRHSLALLQQQRQDNIDPLELRMVYIPTALYALRKDSNNTPGKQRQRARADGKKRRNAVVQMLSRLMGEKVAISAVTLDWDDGSVKQPEITQDGAVFPQSGREAICDWKPHLIYVQGGNTFWLYHCMKKGGWEEALVEACCNTNNGEQQQQPKAVYIGVSAGAILVGNSMQTACWKGWDDPSVVPGMESYDDWDDIKGLALSGSTSFFPHMEVQWQDLIDDRVQALPQDSSAEELSPILCCLADEDVCYVDGKHKSLHSTGALQSRVPAPAL